MNFLPVLDRRRVLVNLSVSEIGPEEKTTGTILASETSLVDHEPLESPDKTQRSDAVPIGFFLPTL